MDFSAGGDRLTEAEWRGLTPAEQALHEAAGRRAGLTWEQWIVYPRAQRNALVAAERARGGGGAGDGGPPPCPLGETRDPVTMRCVPFNQGVNQLPPGWQNWNEDQRAEYARQAVARQGGTTAEQQAAAERARAADNAMIVGIVTQGLGFIRSWLQGRTQERIAEIEARARVEVARIMAQAGSQGGLMNGWGTNPGGGNGGNGGVQQQPASSGGELMLIPLLMMLFR